ncbi:MAG: HEAT repeat domain-containing protein [Pirellulales bacterium]
MLTLLAAVSGSAPLCIAVGLPKATEKELLQTLKSGSPEEKAIACKQLAIYGSKEAVPELAKLLPDEQLSSWARIALEAIPDPAADGALVEAAKTLKGRLLVGALNSIGVRRSPGAIEVLADRLSDSDDAVASASAVALGRIGGDEAISALHQAYNGASPAVRSAIAEGGILIAERYLADKKYDQAVAIYDLIRSADVPQQRMLEATRGAIIARGAQGVPLLVEQLKSSDNKRFALGLMVSRQLSGQEVAEALSARLADAKPERAALILAAIGDREDSKLPAAVLTAAEKGDQRIRLAAIEVLGRKGDESTVPTLLEIAASDEAELSQAAKAALVRLAGQKVNAELAQRLHDAKGKPQLVLIELVGQRRIDAVADLVAALRSSDEATRNAALVALGATAGPKDLTILITAATSAQSAADIDRAERALQAAAIRMPDREATAATLAAAIPKAPKPVKASLVRILGAMGGPKALGAIAVAVKSGDVELQDVGTQVLGEWMTPDAAPVLLEIAKSSAPEKYRVRSLRGYFRIARQQKLPDAERLALVREGLAVAQRDEERELALDALKRCPSAESIKLASAMMDEAGIRERAVETAIFIGEKIKDKHPAAAKSAAEKVLKVAPDGKLAERAKALTNSK